MCRQWYAALGRGGVPLKVELTHLLAPWWNNRVGWIPNREDPPPPNTGTLLHDVSCASYALHAYCIRGSQCVLRATRIVQRVSDVVRVVERFFKFVPNA